MSEKEKKILDTFAEVIPKMTEIEKESLLSFGEGIAFKSREIEREKQKEQKGD